MLCTRGDMAEVKHTMFAGMAFGLAELFKHSVGKKRLSGPVPYGVELSAPDGPSTAGGKQALQHVKLVPEQGGPTLLIGTANAVDKTAELRTFKHVDEMHRQRFKGIPFEADPTQYDDLIAAARAFFADYKYTVTITEAPPKPVAPQAAAPSRPMPAVSSRPVPPAGVAKLPTSRLRVILTVAVTAAVVIAVALFLRH
jgi:hypothetical protein